MSNNEETELERWLKEKWAAYQSDDYTSYGKLNLVACIGEKGGLIIALFEQLRAEIEQLQAKTENKENERE